MTDVPLARMSADARVKCIYCGANEVMKDPIAQRLRTRSVVDEEAACVELGTVPPRPAAVAVLEIRRAGLALQRQDDMAVDIALRRVPRDFRDHDRDVTGLAFGVAVGTDQADATRVRGRAGPNSVSQA